MSRWGEMQPAGPVAAYPCGPAGGEGEEGQERKGFRDEGPACMCGVRVGFRVGGPASVCVCVGGGGRV